MDERTYCLNWIAGYSENSCEAITPDWNGSASRADLNLSFRHKIIDYLCGEMTPNPPLALALLQAETAYCEEAECTTAQLRMLGELFFVLSEGQHIQEYRTCKYASFDVYHALIPELLNKSAMAHLQQTGVLPVNLSLRDAIKSLNAYLKQ